MAFRDTWHRALVYFGLAEDPEYQEPDLYEPETGAQGEYYEGPSRSGTGSPLRERRRFSQMPRGTSARPARNTEGSTRKNRMPIYGFV